MSDKEKSGDDKPDSPFEQIQKQLQELFGRANFTILKPDSFGASSGASAPPPPKPEPPPAGEALARIRDFRLTPREVKAHLDRFVIRQDEAKKVFAVALCDHFHHVRRCIEKPELADSLHPKQNMLLLGPTGVGKTHLMRTAAKLIGVPFVKADATKFSETGYVGGDVDDLVRDLVKAANGDTELAQYGIIYIDEVDKIAAQASAGGRDVSGRGVQSNLLKLMEDTEVNLVSQTDMLGQMQAAMDFQRSGKRGRNTLNTRHILFIVSGAFTPMAGLVRKRLHSSRIGFASGPAAPADDNEWLAHAETQDFIAFGFEPEFIGRLPVRVALQHLDKNDLRQILSTAEGSVLEKYRMDLEGYGIALDFTDDALDEVAARAAAEKTGARGLLTVLERVLRDFKFELPSTPIRTLRIDAAAVRDPATALKGLLETCDFAAIELAAREAGEFAAEFNRNTGLELQFDAPALRRIEELARGAGVTARAFCATRFKDLGYGLRLVAQGSGRRQFTINAALVDDPDREVSRMILENYRGAGPG
ncbi:MAG: AAA family ATPase [Kiritimatiellia bacterium]